MTLSRLRESLAIALIAALPFHALLVTVGTKLIAGPGHAPMPVLAIWKECFLGVILLIACIEILRSLKTVRFDVIDLCIIGLLFLVFFVSNLQSVVFSFQFALGFKYSLLPLVSFLVLRRVTWTERFSFLVSRFLLLVGVVVAVYGIVTYVLPQAFFTWLGYSDLHSLYVPDAPLATFQQIGGTAIRRMQSTMSGPNQLGMWLLIPLGCLLAMAAFGNDRRHKTEDGRKNMNRRYVLLSYLFCLTALLFTFSRAAWVGAAVITVVAFWMHLPRKKFWVATGSLCILGLLMALGAAKVAPGIFERGISSRRHIERPLEALRLMMEHPMGLGLGSAGPATHRRSDACVHLPEDADPSWAEAHPELCVFIEDVQVQPTNRACRCPLLPENWYVQIGVELGWIGFFLFVALIAHILRGLWKSHIDSPTSQIHTAVFLSSLGISIAALFLHAWEDSAVAYTIWILTAVVLTQRRNQPCSEA